MAPVAARVAARLLGWNRTRTSRGAPSYLPMEWLVFEFLRAWAIHPCGMGCWDSAGQQRFGVGGPEESASPEEQRRLNALRIALPVLASMYRRGWLNPTPAGVITWQELLPVCVRLVSAVPQPTPTLRPTTR